MSRFSGWFHLASKHCTCTRCSYVYHWNMYTTCTYHPRGRMSRALRPDFTSTARSAIENSITTPIIIRKNSVIFIVVGLLSLAMQSDTIYKKYGLGTMMCTVLYFSVDQGNKFYWRKSRHALNSSGLKSSCTWWRLCLVEFKVIMFASKNINCTYHLRNLNSEISIDSFLHHLQNIQCTVVTDLCAGRYCDEKEAKVQLCLGPDFSKYTF